MQRSKTQIDAITSVGTIPIILGGPPLIHNGLSYQRATIDFSDYLPDKLWDNEGFIVLTKTFCTDRDVMDLHGYAPSLAVNNPPPMPMSTSSALTDIARKYCSGPKAVSGFCFHFDVAELDKLTTITPEARIWGIVGTILHACAGHPPVDYQKLMQKTFQ
jgi:hypothetical protein